jgi:hypothetical protein
MKVHTTNYNNTFIQIADDCPATKGETPPLKAGKETVASKQFKMISKHPYHFTSDEILFQLYADKNDLIKSEYTEAREQFFSKGQACLRASPLCKRYGWGIHHDKNGKVAIYGCETERYLQLSNDPSVKKVKAMRSSK